MAGFTKKEIAAELKRRDDQIQRENQARREQQDRSRRENTDTACAHCGIPINSVGRYIDFPLCDACDGD